MFTSPYPDVDVPEQNVFDYLFGDLGDDERDRVALVDGTSGAQTTYGQLVDRIEAFAGALAARGGEVGSVVGLLCPNSPAFAVAFHGILRAGATATTINSLYKPDEIAAQLANAGATWLVTVSALLAGAKTAAASAGIDDAHLIVLDGADGHPSLQDLLTQGAPAPKVTFDPATHLAVLPYSSGTTGIPKGVMLTHRNLVANVAQTRVIIGLGPDDRVLAVLPFYHIYGMTVLLNFALKQRSSLVTMPRFDLAEFLRVISEHRATFVFIAPPIAVALAKSPLVDEYDLSTVRVVFSGAAPLDGALAATVAERLDTTVSQGYGLTETSPVTHAIPLERDDLDRSSIGLLLPNLEARLLDPETGTDVEPPVERESAPGELLLRGPNIMHGYLGNDAATAATLDGDGWLHTGDVATVGLDGAFRIVDRLKELIKYKGYQVAPAVLEAVLLAHPLVTDAAVIGVADADGQEIPKAFVVARPDAALSADDVIAFVAERVAPYERVRVVEFIDQIPKSTAGKILRKELRAREQGGRSLAST
ncbi:AMP-binding protein [Cryobacterium tepidiphilum]|uniref:4-coumarate--CoA ligase family protein n=1 Tax=Cryobacterium tepidiphilum TaxID=2486026 RepID=A0A3M8LPB2_9MICO|nr:AMP-binding protein [Cryobacterium tepidiphilum]RNE67323.1 4-coumarate--CoA ligase family protein [Cryobacterium tepidiphilum]